MNKILLAFLLITFAFAEVSAKTVQSGYRWRNDDGDETTATWKAPIRQPVYLGGIETIRLRLQIDEGLDSEVFNEEISLYYSSGTFGSPWQKITTNPGNAFVLFNSPHLPDLSPTSRQLNAQDRTFQPGLFFGSTFDYEVTIPLDHYSEYEWALRPSVSADPSVYYFAMGFDGEDFPEIITGVFSEEEAATLYYKVRPPGVPLKTWSVYGTLVLLVGFVLIRYRRLI